MLPLLNICIKVFSQINIFIDLIFLAEPCYKEGLAKSNSIITFKNLNSGEDFNTLVH